MDDLRIMGPQTFIAGLSTDALIAPWVIKGAMDEKSFRGIAKLSDAGRGWPEAVSSGGHLKCISVPQINGVGSGLAESVGWHLVAAGAENDIDLVVGGEEPLRLARGFESPHQLFAFPG